MTSKCKLYINKQYVGDVTGLGFDCIPKIISRNKCIHHFQTSIRCSIKNRYKKQDGYDSIIFGEYDTFGSVVYIQIKDVDGHGNESTHDRFNGYYKISSVEFDTTYEGKVTDIITCADIDD